MAKKNKAKKGGKKVTKKTVTTTTVTTTTTVDKNLDTHYLLVLDRSGSMGSCWKSTIEGLNEQLATIRSLEEKYPEQRYYVTLVVFDYEITTVFEDKAIKEIDDFDGTEFPPRGSTALHDAMGIGISNLRTKLAKKDKKNDSISTALVVVMTDGGENASKEYNSKSIKSIIEELEEDGSWTFSFMGANQDSFLTARDFGIAAGNVVNYTSTNDGATAAYSTLNQAMTTRANSNSRLYRQAVVTASASGSDVTLDLINLDNTSFMSSVVDGDTIGEDTSNVKKDESEDNS